MEDGDGEMEDATSSLTVEEKDNLHRSTKKIKTGIRNISKGKQDQGIGNEELPDDGREQRRKARSRMWF